MPIAKIELPDGRIARFEVPEGTTPEQVTAFAEKQFSSKPAAPSTAPSKSKGGIAGGMFMGAIRDPLDAGAQLLVRGAESVAGMIPDALGGDTARQIMAGERERVDGIVKGANAEYEQSRKLAGRDGFDAARLTGNVVSPANLAVAARVAPLAAAKTLPALAGRGAAQSAAVASLQPVLDTDNFGMQKALQVGAGAVGGAFITPAAAKIGESLTRAVRDLMGRGAAAKSPQAIEMEIKASLQRDDIDIGQIPKHVMDNLTKEVNSALSKGQALDAPSLLRKMDFDRVGVKPLLGQLTRDPSQYTREMNLRGVQGVGEPIANRLSEQQAVIASKFRQGVAGAENPYEAGEGLITALQAKNAEMEGGVRAAYQAFRESTGKDLPVQLSTMRSGYKEALKEYGEVIPSAVRNRFDEILNGPKPAHSHGAKAPAQSPLQILDANGGVLSDLSQKPTPRNLSVEDAERLIKTINRHYNPADRAQARALDELRGHVQSAIYGASDDGSGAGALAQQARATAKQRFDTIDSTPALKAAIDNSAPDDFVKKYVINGKVRELNKLAELVGPDGKRTMQQQLLKHLQSKAFGANAAGDGAGRQASLNSELESIGRNKLMALLGAQQTDDLYALGRVMAYIQQQPAGSAVNNSNTGAMVASLLGKVGGKIKGAPYINDFVVKPISSFQDRAAVGNALTGQLPKQAAELPPEVKNRLLSLIAPLQIGFSSAVGSPSQ